MTFLINLKEKIEHMQTFWDIWNIWMKLIPHVRRIRLSMLCSVIHQLTKSIMPPLSDKHRMSNKTHDSIKDAILINVAYDSLPRNL
jgi:hypothetical protein